MKINRNNILAIMMILLLSTSACVNDLDSIRPRNQILQEDLTEDDAHKLLTGLYAQMEALVFRFWFDFDVRGENFRAGPGGSLIDPVSMSANDARITQMWQQSFTTLKQINFLIESYEADNSLGAIGGAVYYFRALTYYNLAARWGNVSVLRKRTYDVVPLSAESDVWAFVEEDIEKAISLLGNSSDRYYVSPEAAHALAARIYLATNKKDKALEHCNKILGGNKYALVNTSTAFAEAFTPDNKNSEIIFSLANKRTSGYLSFSNDVNDVDASWSYSATEHIFTNLFNDDSPTNRMGDIRKAATFSSDPSRIIKFPNGVAGNQLVPTSNAANTPINVSRLSEIYLIKAELLGQTDGAETLAEFLRSRYAAASPAIARIQALSDREYQNLLLDERNREFYAEGYRWYDIKRTKRTDLLETLDGRNYLLYYPVPQTEIDLAGKDAYPQNNGYSTN